MSGWNASQRLEHAPAEPPDAPIRCLSMFHSPALLRTNCNARAASCNGHSTGGFTPAASASWTKRYSMETTEMPAFSISGSSPTTPLERLPPVQPPPWMKNSSGAGDCDSAFQKCRTCLGCFP